MYRRLLPLLLIPVAVLAACSGGDAPAEESAEPDIYTARGMFARAEDDGVTMTVRHEEIVGFMAAMTMPFKVADGTMLDGLAYGDKIEFQLEVGGENGMVVTSISKLPEDTVLSFETP